MNKSKLLNWLQEEHQRWEALLKQLDPLQMDQVGVTSQWSFKERLEMAIQLVLLGHFFYREACYGQLAIFLDNGVKPKCIHGLASTQIITVGLLKLWLNAFRPPTS